MARPLPYTYYSCDCFDNNTPVSSKRVSQILADDEEGRTFDPSNARSNYSLYPLEHLLYCEDCQQIRCPRCVIEETLNWFCPSCLFEVPSSVIKSDGNRCTRNCYNCPVCTSPMTVNSLDTRNWNDPSTAGSPYILACPYCHWTTAEIGIEFEKHTGITTQLSRIANGGRIIPTQKERDKERDRKKEAESKKHQGRDVLSGSDDSPTLERSRSKEEVPLSRDDIYSNLQAFYKAQIESQTPANPFSPHDLSFSSPSFTQRMMSFYSAGGSKKQKRNKPAPMREAASALEGLTVHDPASDIAAIERIKREGWGATLSQTQKRNQIDPHIRFQDELRPTAAVLCTKRGKRCRSCRHILSKPESKITSTRYKIKLLALNHIPRISIRALPPQQQGSYMSMTPSGYLPSTANPPFNYNALSPGIPIHFVLQLSNPLFDPIRVTLATPSTTPGRLASRVTILCPQFDVGANTDVWDDALSSSMSPVKRSSLINADGQIEAGKIWDQGRNWTSIVLEVVPGFLDEAKDEEGNKVEIEGDEDVLEIPIFVRIEFEADVSVEERGLGDSRGNKGEKERREEAFWTVLGVGRVAGA
ncbi:dynactin-like protein Arp1 p62 subunit RO2 [Corynespora cassiicola Philippines]|uniref:Dynactin subunit 4 n=1 Tax=Corynespora cassiicola Philippines TaxID=1448308 RepID=A0A2T2NQI4_CORCC|nr:dynactin-like protein Arp1 p62 subunit RO2 [Corynespora cassiicola Philippines]